MLPMMGRFPKARRNFPRSKRFPSGALRVFFSKVTTNITGLFSKFLELGFQSS